MGVRVSAEEIKSELSRRGVTGEDIAQTAQSFRCSNDYIYEACASWMAAARVQLLLATSIETSLPRVRAAYTSGRLHRSTASLLFR